MPRGNTMLKKVIITALTKKILAFLSYNMQLQFSHNTLMKLGLRFKTKLMQFHTKHEYNVVVIEIIL